jgi:hypothetical protein
MCEIAFPIRNTLKKLFEVEFWLVLEPNTQKAGFWNVMLFTEKHFVERLAGRSRLLRALRFLYRLVKHEEVN